MWSQLRQKVTDVGLLFARCAAQARVQLIDFSAFLSSMQVRVCVCVCVCVARVLLWLLLPARVPCASSHYSFGKAIQCKQAL